MINGVNNEICYKYLFYFGLFSSTRLLAALRASANCIISYNMARSCYCAAGEAARGLKGELSGLRGGYCKGC